MKVKVSQSYSTFCGAMDYTIHGILQARILKWVAFPFSRGSNPGLLHCGQILYQLSHKGSPILECAAYSFSSGSSPPRNPIGVSCIAGKFFTNWAVREAISYEVLVKRRWIKDFEGHVEEEHLHNSWRWIMSGIFGK